MKRYIPTLTEDRKNNWLDQAEQHLNQGNFNSAVRAVGRAMGMITIPDRFDDKLARQELNYNQNGNNINNHAVLSNIQKILSGKGGLIKKQYDEPVIKQSKMKAKIDKAVQDHEAKVRAEYDVVEEPEDVDELMDVSPEEDEEKIIKKDEDDEELIMERYRSKFKEEFYSVKVIVDKKFANDFKDEIENYLSWEDYDESDYFDSIEFGFTQKDFNKYINKILKKIRYPYDVEDY